jgi:hypothetical protein
MDYGSSYEKGVTTLKPETKFWHKVKKAMPFLQPCTKTKNFMKALAACRLQLKA